MQNSNEQSTIKPWISIAIVLILLSALGFPGTYTLVFGEWFGTVIEYSSFLIQIAIMLVSSGKTIYDIKLIDMKARHYHIYAFLLVIWIVSMIGTSSHSDELVTVIRISVTAFFALWLADNLTTEELLERVYYAQILFVIASIAFPVFFSAYDTRPDSYIGYFVGISSVKNVVAGELAFGIIMQTLLWKVRKEVNKSVSPVFVAVMATQLVLLFMAHATGSMITAGFVLFMIWRSSENRRLHLGFVCVITSLSFLIFALTIIPLFGSILSALGEDATLTGRIPLWNQIINVMRTSHTFTGFGYGHFWFDDEALSLVHEGFGDNSFFGKMKSGCHNSVLELWANTGLIGVISFFGTIIIGFSGADRLNKQKYIFVMAFMIYFTLKGLTEREWSNYEYDTLFFFIALGVASQKTEGFSEEWQTTSKLQEQ